MNTIDFCSTTEFRSSRYPGVTVRIRKPTVGARIAIQKRIDEARGDLEWRQALRALWNELVADFNVTIDGRKPGVEELFLRGDEELVDEVSTELVRMTRPLGSDDEADRRLIEDCRRQIREAEERIERRKNSAPQSSGPGEAAGTRTADETAATSNASGASGEAAATG